MTRPDRLAVSGLALVGLTAFAIAEPPPPAAKEAAKPAAVAAAPGVARAGAIDLRPRYSAGQEMTFEQHSVRTDEMHAKALADQTVQFNATVTWSVKVLTADATGAELHMTPVSVKGMLDQKGQAQAGLGATEPEGSHAVWDSTVPDAELDKDNQVLQGLRPILGADIKVMLDPNGKILSVSGSEAVQPPKAVAGQYGYQLIAPDPFKARWGPVLAIKDSAGPVAVGETWQSEEVASAGPMGRSKYTWKRTVKSADADTATIESAGTYEMLGVTEGQAPMGKVSDASVSGICIWDLKAGACRSLTIHQKSTLDANMQGFELKRTSDAESTITRK